MNAGKVLIAVVAAALIGAVLSSTTATSQPPAVARRTVFFTLKVGQPVVLKDKGGLYEIGTTDAATPLTHKVAEIGDDFIVVQDEAGVTETRIPVTAVRAVILLKTKGK